MMKKLEFQPTIDLFASRINHQLKVFYSFRPDPECYGVDAFTVDWHDIQFYAFPPFSCVARTIQKICQDGAIGLLVVSDWPNQPWYGAFLDIIIKRIFLPPREDLLHLPQKERKHPLREHLGLIAAIVSGRL